MVPGSVTVSVGGCGLLLDDVRLTSVSSGEECWKPKADGGWEYWLVAAIIVVGESSGERGMSAAPIYMNICAQMSDSVG